MENVVFLGGWSILGTEGQENSAPAASVLTTDLFLKGRGHPITWLGRFSLLMLVYHRYIEKYWYMLSNMHQHKKNNRTEFIKRFLENFLTITFQARFAVKV